MHNERANENEKAYTFLLGVKNVFDVFVNVWIFWLNEHQFSPVCAVHSLNCSCINAVMMDSLTILTNDERLDVKVTCLHLRYHYPVAFRIQLNWTESCRVESSRAMPNPEYSFQPSLLILPWPFHGDAVCTDGAEHEHR